MRVCFFVGFPSQYIISAFASGNARKLDSRDLISLHRFFEKEKKKRKSKNQILSCPHTITADRQP